MSDTASVKITKSLPWRGNAHLFTNRYHFTGGSPTTNAKWLALFDAVVLVEKTIYHSEVSIVTATGYDPGSDIPVASKTYTTAGTLSVTGGLYQERQVCALGRWTTDQVTSKNHPIYLFSYWHGVFGAGSGAPDGLLSAQKTAMDAYITAWISGFSDGTVTHNRAGPRGAVALTGATETFMTHRDFPR